MNCNFGSRIAIYNLDTIAQIRIFSGRYVGDLKSMNEYIAPVCHALDTA